MSGLVAHRGSSDEVNGHLLAALMALQSGCPLDHFEELLCNATMFVIGHGNRSVKPCQRGMVETSCLSGKALNNPVEPFLSDYACSPI